RNVTGVQTCALPISDAGVDVEVVEFSNTAKMVAPLSTGDIDIASGAPTLGFYNAKLRGLEMKLVADEGRNSKGHGFNAVVIRSRSEERRVGRGPVAE